MKTTTIPKIMLELVVYSDYFDIDSFSDFIHTKPTDYCFKGDISPTYKVVRKSTRWEYSSGYIETYYLEELSNQFVEQFSSLAKKISEYTSKNKLHTYICVVGEFDHDNKPIFHFNKEFLKLSAKLNTEIGMDLYCYIDGYEGEDYEKYGVYDEMVTPRVKLDFSIFGDCFDVEEFSNLLQVKPKDFWLKDENKKETCWKYSYGYKRIYYSQKLSARFIKQFAPLAKKISEYAAKNSLNVKVDITAECFYSQKPAITFNKSFLRLLAKLNAEVDVNLYCLREL
ncbi:MAG: DUF4279 domain-containing protein [Campylobacteraceae bacterium]|jgi:hypothetical protein|nr:DUF4279 domain-containing protein [Campylobacteraceae bacterium]